MTQLNPNIVLIHCHDLGRQLGCYDRGVDTPAVDALADEGALFENHFASAPQCSPSRGSLHTGQYPHVNGLMGLAHEAWEINPDVRRLPEYLAEVGYQTHLFGLQHVTNDPTRLGFQHDHSEANLSPAASPALHDVNRARDVSKTVEVWLEKDAYQEPFMASIGFFEAHRIEVNDHFGFDDGQYECPAPDEVEIPPFLLDAPGIRSDLAEMVGMVAAIDSGVERIMDAIDANGLREDTFLLFTTEHGVAFPRAKGCCYDAGLEAALIVRYPGLFDGGERYDELLSNVDVLSTLLDLVPDAAPDEGNGRSFLPLVTDREYVPRDRIFAEMTWHDRYNPVRAIRTNRFKYIRNFWRLPAVYLTNDVLVSKSGLEVREKMLPIHRPYEELYDLDTDPTERSNLAGVERYEDVRRVLEEELIQWMRQTDDPLLDGPIPPADYHEIEFWRSDEPSE